MLTTYFSLYLHLAWWTFLIATMVGLPQVLFSLGEESEMRAIPGHARTHWNARECPLPDFGLGWDG